MKLLYLVYWGIWMYQLCECLVDRTPVVEDLRSRQTEVTPTNMQQHRVILESKHNQSTFLWYEDLYLACVLASNQGGISKVWTVRRKTAFRVSESCCRFGIAKGTICTIADLYPSDSGSYWCESETGERSNVLDIEVAYVQALQPRREQEEGGLENETGLTTVVCDREQERRVDSVNSGCSVLSHITGVIVTVMVIHIILS